MVTTCLLDLVNMDKYTKIDVLSHIRKLCSTEDLVHIVQGVILFLLCRSGICLILFRTITKVLLFFKFSVQILHKRFAHIPVYIQQIIVIVEYFCSCSKKNNENVRP